MEEPLWLHSNGLKSLEGDRQQPLLEDCYTLGVELAVGVA